MTKIDLDLVRRAVTDLEARTKEGTAVVYSGITTDGVRFVGQRPESWDTDTLTRSVVRTVVAITIGSVPPSFLDSMIEGTDVENGDELKDLVAELSDQLPATELVYDFKARTLVPPLARLKYEVLAIGEHQAADIEFRADVQGTNPFILLGPLFGSPASSDDKELTFRLLPADIKYLIEQLENVLGEFETGDKDGD